MTKVTIEKGELVTRTPLDEAGVPSASGKSKVHATTRGNIDTGLKIEGRTLFLGLNAYSK